MQLAFQIAESNDLPLNFNTAKRIAGKDWYNSFMKRQPALNLRQPELHKLLEHPVSTVQLLVASMTSYNIS